MYFIFKVAVGFILAEIILTLLKFDAWKSHLTFYSVGEISLFLLISFLTIAIPLSIIYRVVHLYLFYIKGKRYGESETLYDSYENFEGERLKLYFGIVFFIIFTLICFTNYEKIFSLILYLFWTDGRGLIFN